MTTGSETTPFEPGRRILITGAGGFIGSAIADLLCERGYAVRALIRKTGNRSFLPRSAEIAIGDVCEPETLTSALSGVDGVIHCAGATRALSLEAYLRVNRDGTRNVLAECAEGNSRRRVVCLGSLAAFGPSAGRKPTFEEDPPHPVSNYGISKLEGHRVAEDYSKVLPLTILVPPAVYGPRDRDIFAYFKLGKAGILPMIGREARYLSIAHVRDIAEAALVCLLHPAAVGRSYFVSDGTIHTWDDFADAIAEAIGKKPVRIHIPRWAARAIALAGDSVAAVTRRPPLLGSQKMRELVQPAWVCSSDRIQRELGFVPFFPLRPGIQDAYRWYLSHGWL